MNCSADRSRQGLGSFVLIAVGNSSRNQGWVGLIRAGHRQQNICFPKIPFLLLRWVLGSAISCIQPLSLIQSLCCLCALVRWCLVLWVFSWKFSKGCCSALWCSLAHTYLMILLLRLELKRICGLVFREIFQESRDTPWNSWWNWNWCFSNPYYIGGFSVNSYYAFNIPWVFK